MVSYIVFIYIQTFIDRWSLLAKYLCGCSATFAEQTKHAKELSAKKKQWTLLKVLHFFWNYTGCQFIRMSQNIHWRGWNSRLNRSTISANAESNVSELKLTKIILRFVCCL